MSYDSREFPREIVRILNTGIAAEAARGRHKMRGVADEECPAVSKAIGDIGRHFPGTRIHELGCHVLMAGRLAHEFAAARRIKLLRAFPTADGRCVDP